MVVSDVNKAEGVLRVRGFALSVTEVICLSVPNHPGAVHRALSLLSQANISVEYMYAFAVGSNAFVMIRTNDIEQSISVLVDNRLTLVPASQLRDY